MAVFWVLGCGTGSRKATGSAAAGLAAIVDGWGGGGEGSGVAMRGR